MTPREVADLLLARPLSDDRFRKVRRHLPTPAGVLAMVAEIEKKEGAEIAQQVREGMERVGAL